MAFRHTNKTKVRIRHPAKTGAWVDLTGYAKGLGGLEYTDSPTIRDVPGTEVDRGQQDVRYGNYSGSMTVDVNPTTAAIFGSLACRLMEFEISPEGTGVGKLKQVFQAWTATSLPMTPGEAVVATITLTGEGGVTESTY